MQEGRHSLSQRIVPLLVLLCAVLTGCQTQRDATLAAQQMSATTATLQGYYGSLLKLVDQNEQAQIAQSYLNGTPYADAITDLETTRGHLKQRVAMAAALTRLSALFSDLASSSAAGDVAKAADNLNSELVSLKAFPSDEKEKELLKVSANALINIIKAHDEVKAAALIKPVAASLADFFDKEEDSYISFANSYYQTASSNAGLLLGKSQVSNDFLYRSSLRPFGLTPQITDESLRKFPAADLQARVADRLAAKQKANRAAAVALSDSLHIMRDRVAQVAAHKPLRASLPPFTLEGVKAWVLEIKSDLGE